MAAASKTVLVTGATGYIASHTIQQLLEKTDFAVRGTVRNLQDKAKFAHLTALPHADTRLELVQADLLDAASWAPAVRGCVSVFHIASPYIMAIQDAQKDLVEPAEQGTENVLRAAIAESSVTDIVLTSSIAAIAPEPIPGHVITEADWNTTSSLDWNPYPYSKVCAEKKAWALMDGVQDTRLVVLNPGLVIGPTLSKGINTSVAVSIGMFNGQVPAMVNLSWCVVDVRDVALAHILALQTATASGRYLLFGQICSMQEFAAVFRAKFPTAKHIPTWTVPNWVAWLASFKESRATGQYMRSNVGFPFEADNSKSTRELGMTYRPVQASLVDMIDDAVKWGLIDPTNVYTRELKRAS
ncbi:Aste57867_18574 [Aphanomyces stellatus]|uniref:Aste57867_18574 protein n=1 Tax=Aphanomyces stellatus TaxID=120398 RepID=A0A485LC44_9STRA|nr:hypothetical protein As57867_018512 [Aphanomyces stellatus]VFT95310.1 Aste57867_18574 [Aphanomyces stellatus]